jgi:hypothetical protein
MSPEQAKLAIGCLQSHVESCERHLATGEWDGKPHSADAMQWFRERAEACRAAILVLEDALPVVVQFPQPAIYGARA